MREIKFRFFRELPTPKMIYPESDFLINHLGVPCIISRFSNNRIEVNIVEVIPLQFTGFHDKNGKEIYEGDILDCGQDPNAEVWWDEELGQFSISTYHATLSLCDNLRNAKIKGNKYENPELL